jgi:hypothetical protein
MRAWIARLLGAVPVLRKLPAAPAQAAGGSLEDVPAALAESGDGMPDGPDSQARLVSLVARTETEILHPFLAGYLRLGLASVRHPNPAQALLAEAGRFVGWTGGRAAEDQVHVQPTIGAALQAVAAALSAPGLPADDSPAFALGLVRGRQIVFGMGWAFGQTIHGHATRQDLGAVVRETSARPSANAVRLLRGETPIADAVLSDDGLLTLRLPPDPEDARACALLLAQGLWEGRSDASTEAALARLSQVPPLPATTRRRPAP